MDYDNTLSELTVGNTLSPLTFSNIKNKYADYKPYSLDQVTEFETNNGITFPQEFKKYLTEVSSHIYKKHLGFQKIELCSSNIGQIYTRGLINPYYLYDEESDSTIPKHVLVKVFFLREIGCGYRNLIVVDEKNLDDKIYRYIGCSIGSIWTDYSCGSGSVRELCDNFIEYINDEDYSDCRMPSEKVINKRLEQDKKREESAAKYREQNKQTDSEKIASFADAYNILRILANQPGLSYSN